jgi:hypothetical protein
MSWMNIHMNELHGVGINDTDLLSNFHAYYHVTSLLSHVDKKQSHNAHIKLKTLHPFILM